MEDEIQYYEDSKVIGIRLRWDREQERIALEFLDRMQYHEGMNAREVITKALNWYEKHLAEAPDRQEQILAELKAIRATVATKLDQ
jgi:hypothetical protein